MTFENLPDCPAQAIASRLDRIERLRDVLPSAHRILERMAGRLPASLIEEMLVQDEDLLIESERLRDALADAEPRSLEGAVALVMRAERDWLSADPQLKLRAVSMVRQATAFLVGRRIEAVNAARRRNEWEEFPLSAVG